MGPIKYPFPCIPFVFLKSFADCKRAVFWPRLWRFAKAKPRYKFWLLTAKGEKELGGDAQANPESLL